MRKSDGQDKRVFFRADDRFFRIDSDWFYTTREGEQGPFASQKEAKRHLDQFVALEAMKVNQFEKVEKIRREKVDADPTVWNRQIDLS